jgi:hypothetical protein
MTGFCTVDCFELTPKEKVHLNFALKAEMERLGLPMLPKRHTKEDRFLANQYPPELIDFATAWLEKHRDDSGLQRTLF